MDGYSLFPFVGVNRKAVDDGVDVFISLLDLGGVFRVNSWDWREGNPPGTLKFVMTTPFTESKVQYSSHLDL
ncbi:UNVERIFIED_CONTAM: hypothetical protein ACS92_05560 [Bacillus cereus]